MFLYKPYCPYTKYHNILRSKTKTVTKAVKMGQTTDNKWMYLAFNNKPELLHFSHTNKKEMKVFWKILS